MKFMVIFSSFLICANPLEELGSRDELIRQNQFKMSFIVPREKSWQKLKYRSMGCNLELKDVNSRYKNILRKVSRQENISNVSIVDIDNNDIPGISILREKYSDEELSLFWENIENLRLECLKRDFYLFSYAEKYSAENVTKGDLCLYENVNKIGFQFEDLMNFKRYLSQTRNFDLEFMSILFEEGFNLYPSDGSFVDHGDMVLEKFLNFFPSFLNMIENRDMFFDINLETYVGLFKTANQFFSTLEIDDPIIEKYNLFLWNNREKFLKKIKKVLIHLKGEFNTSGYLSNTKRTRKYFENLGESITLLVYLRTSPQILDDIDTDEKIELDRKVTKMATDIELLVSSGLSFLTDKELVELKGNVNFQESARLDGLSDILKQKISLIKEMKLRNKVDDESK